MSLTIGNNSPYVNGVSNTSPATTPTQNSAVPPTTAYRNDGVSLSATASTAGPLPDKAGAMTRISNAFGNFFSNVADKMGIGETYKLVAQEFNQVDMNKDQSLNQWEFNVATMNLADFTGSEFARADQNRNGRVEEKEYVNYRKEALSYAFDRKDANNDSHVSVNEIGSVGRMLLEKRDVRLDENGDGLVNKREFTKASVRGAISIRDFLGF